MKQRLRKQGGFTLAEMMVVLLLITILCSIAVPSFSNIWQQVQIDACVQQIHRDIRWAQRQAAREQIPVTITFYRDSQPYRYKIGFSRINKQLCTQRFPCRIDQLTTPTLTIQPDKSFQKNGHILLQKGEHERYVYFYQTGRTRVTRAPAQ